MLRLYKSEIARLARARAVVLRGGKASFTVGWSVYDPKEDSTPGDVLQRASAKMLENKRLMKFSENILDA